MYYFNAYDDVIDDFITIYNFLEMALSSMIYIINVQKHDTLSRYFFLSINFIYLTII